MDLLIVLAALGTSILSAIFGMAGGLILMGLYVTWLPVVQAMILHGWTQAVANGLRAALWWRNIRWQVLGWYLLGSLIVWSLLRLVRWVPSPTMVFLGLGALPFVGQFLNRHLRLPDLEEHPSIGLLAGMVVSAVQGLAGVAGPLLDFFFLDTRMGRREVVATKAVTQMVSHLLKLAWYLEVATDSPEASQMVAAAVAAVGGTVLGALALEQVSDTWFRVASRWMILGVGGYYLFKGFHLWWG